MLQKGTKKERIVVLKERIADKKANKRALPK